MKTPILFLLAILALPLSAQAQKKDAALAVAYSVFLPGGGHIYTQNQTAGAFFIGSEVGCAAWYIILHNKSEHAVDLDPFGRLRPRVAPSLVPIYLLITLKLVDIITAPLSVDRYNESLLERLSVTMEEGRIGVRFSL